VTPCTIEVDANRKKQITIYVSKDGYKIEEKTFKLVSGKEIDVSLQLQKIKVNLPPPPTNDTPVNVNNENRIMGKDGAPMVLIPAGEFVMGSNNGNVDYGMNKEHTVNVDAFYMDVYEVTNEQYRKFIEATGHPAPTCWNDPNLNEPKQPVVDVTWDDAMAYCQWVGERLPTEAEWEKSAKGGLVGKLYAYGDDISHDKANYFGTDGKDTWSKPAPVGSFVPNGYGLYDMVGNVWEWCADWFSDSYYAQSPKDNPKGPDSGSARVLRGGAWNVSIEYLYVAKRYSRNPQSKYYKDHGFRCAKDVEN
jgi:iron(II)-dependent oxidoreductase